MRRYDFYADMYAAHSEIGYLLWLLLMLLLSDGGLALALALWPQADVYLVPGISGYAQVPVIWGDRLPLAVQARPPSASLLQVDLDRLQPGDGSGRRRGGATGEPGGDTAPTAPTAPCVPTAPTSASSVTVPAEAAEAGHDSASGDP